MTWGARQWGSRGYGDNTTDVPGISHLKLLTAVVTESVSLTTLVIRNTSAFAYRLRTSALTPSVSITAIGSRARSGAAFPYVKMNVSAAGTRARSGSAFPFIPVYTGGGVPGFQWRWRIDDPLDGSSLTFTSNANSGGSPKRARNVQVDPTVAPDGNPLYFEGSETIRTGEIKGVILDQAQYDIMTSWFKRKHLVLLTDDLGRQMQVVLEQFVPKREPRRHFPLRHTYTATYRVVASTLGVP